MEIALLIALIATMASSILQRAEWRKQRRELVSENERWRDVFSRFEKAADERRQAEVELAKTQHQ